MRFWPKNFWTILPNIILWSGFALGEQTISGFRVDFNNRLSSRLCSEGRGISMRDLWNAKIFDAQVEGSFLHAAGKFEVSDDYLRAKAVHDAEERNHKSFAWGRCGASQNAWIMTAPAPADAMSISGGQLNISSRRIQKYCSEISVDYADATNATSFKNITADEQGSYSLEKLEPGTVSVTCLKPAEGANRSGAQLWFLIPIGNRSLNFVEEISPTSKSGDTKLESILALWVDRLRTNAQLKSLQISERGLQKSAYRLAASRTLAHNRQELDRQKHELEKQQLKLIGEDRVIGRDLGEIKWLLWNSPRHRALLLDPQATHLAVNYQQTAQKQMMVVLVTASAHAKNRDSR